MIAAIHGGYLVSYPACAGMCYSVGGGPDIFFFFIKNNFCEQGVISE